MNGTSAKKLEYDVYSRNKILKQKKKSRQNKKLKVKAFLFLTIAFVMVFSLIYRYALMTVMNYEINTLDHTYNDMKNENHALEIDIENMTNLAEIKDKAKKLGFVEPTKQRTVYVALQNEDRTLVSHEYMEKSDTHSGTNMYAILKDKVIGFIKFLY